MAEPESLQILRIVRPLSSFFVNLEKALEENPEMSLSEFCSKHPNEHPNKLLYSKGFNGLLAMGAVVLINEALKNKKDEPSINSKKLRHVRNALCHGKIEFLPSRKIRFVDEITVELLPEEIIDLAGEAWQQYVSIPIQE